MAGKADTETLGQIREDVLRDPQYAVHKIADTLLPYIKVLVEKFHPEQVILFGSYAYGNPDEGSDVDLLIVKNLQDAPIREASAIRKAWRPLRWSGKSLPFDLLVLSPADHLERLRHSAGFYEVAAFRGVRIV